MSNVTPIKPAVPPRMTRSQLEAQVRRIQQIVKAVRISADHDDRERYPDALELCEELLLELYDAIAVPAELPSD